MNGGVIIWCPNKRRVNVKIEGGGKTLFQILEEACKKQGFIPEQYGLKHHNRFVDLSLTFRLSGLPLNCTLEMAELEKTQMVKLQQQKDEHVQIALQFPDGNRLTNNVPPGATLLDVLIDFERLSGKKLVEPEGDLENLQPICQYLNNEFVGSLSLASTTLSRLGVRGKALFRYSSRQIDRSKLEEINESIERTQTKMRKIEESYEKKLQENQNYEREEQRKQEERDTIEQLAKHELQLMSDESVSVIESPDPEVSVRPKTSANAGNSSRLARLEALQSMLAVVDRSIVEGTPLPWEPDEQSALSCHNPEFANFKFPDVVMEETDSTSATHSGSAQSSGQQSVGQLVAPCDRKASCFSTADAADITDISDETPDDFFDVTVRDVQMMQRLLKSESDERPLIPESYLRQKDFERKLEAWKIAVIRIKFPDRTVLQGTFKSMETVASLYRFVEESIADSSVLFQLCVPPNIAVDKLTQSLLEAGLSPRATVIFKLKQPRSITESYLSPRLLTEIKTKAVVDQAAADSLKENRQFMPYRPSTTDTTTQSEATSSKSALPKWYKKA